MHLILATFMPGNAPVPSLVYLPTLFYLKLSYGEFNGKKNNSLRVLIFVSLLQNLHVTIATLAKYPPLSLAMYSI